MDVFIGTQCTFNKVEIIRNAVIEETGTPALTGQFQTCQSCLNCRSVWWLNSCNIIYVLLVCFLHYSFRPLHSTETALLHVLSDIMAAVDHGDFAALVLLDLSAAFDTVDHDILLQRLQTSFGIGGTALKWFQSYLTCRTQYVRRGTA